MSWNGNRVVFFFAITVAFLVCYVLGASAETVSYGGRSSNLVVPAGYDSGTPAPLVLLLHGYGGTGEGQDAYMGFSAIADEFGFLMLNPDGLMDVAGNNFWNATNACCNIYASTVSDSDFLAGLIGEVQALYNIDPDRIFVTGHSNGGFMSYRMACDHADLVVAIASMAGATYDNPASCSPSEPVHVLQIHGTSDTTLLYEGGTILASYPSAVGSVERWNAYNSCSGTSDASTPSIDIVSELPGDETVIVKYTDDCATNGSGELWTITDGSHVPDFNSQYARSVVEYFYARPRVFVAPVSEPAAAPALSDVPLGILVAALASMLTVFGRRRRTSCPIRSE